LINRFIGTQTSLEWFDMSEWVVSADLDVEILQNLSLGSCRTLQHLDIRGFSTLRSMGANVVPTFRSLMSRFTQLRTLKLHPDWLDEEMLLGLAHTCAGLLQDLTLECTGLKPCEHTISSSTWEQVHRLCPELWVSVSVLLRHDTADIALLLPRGMPLRALRYRSRHQDEVDPGLFQQLNYFTDSLEELELTLQFKYDTTSEEFANFVIACRNLKVLVYRGKLLERDITTICEAQRDGRIRLQQCDLAVRYSSEDGMEDTLGRIEAEYGPVFVSQNACLSLFYNSLCA